MFSAGEEEGLAEARATEIHVTHAFFVKQFLYRMRSLDEARKPIHYLSMTKFVVDRSSGSILLELQNESDLYEAYQRSRLESLQQKEKKRVLIYQLFEQPKL